MSSYFPLFSVASLILMCSFVWVGVRDGASRSKIRGIRTKDDELNVSYVSDWLAAKTASFVRHWIGRRRLVAAFSVFAFLVVIRFQGLIVAVVTSVALAAVVAFILRSIRTRYQRRFENELLDFVESLAYRLQAGGSLASLLVDAADDCGNTLRPSFIALKELVNHGLPVATALRDWSIDTNTDCAREFASVVSLALTSGGNIGESLLRLANSLRRRHRLRAEMMALTSQARSSAWILSVLPVGFGMCSSIFSGQARTFLFHTGAGALVLIVGLIFDGLGAFWLSKIARVEI